MFNYSKKLIAAGLFLIFFSFYLYRLPSLPLVRWDELFWVGKSYFFELMIQGDFKNELWQSVFSYDQPKFGELLFGAYFYPQYQAYKHKIAQPNYAYWQYLIDHNFFESEWESLNPEYKQAYKNNNPNYIHWETDDITPPANYIARYGANFIPTYSLLIEARQLNALLLALSVGVIFLLGSVVGGPVIGLLTALLYGFNPLVISAGLHAYSEALFLLLFNLGLYLLITFFQQKKYSKMRIVILGIVFGLCFSTKLVGIMLLCFYVLFEFVFLLYKKPTRIAQFLPPFTRASIISILTLIIFIALNPFTYSNPIVKISKMFEWRSKVVSDQYPFDAHQIPDSFISRVTNVYWNYYGTVRSADFTTRLPFFSNTSVLYVALFSLGIIFLVVNYLHKKTDRKIIGLFVTIFILLQFFAGIYLKLNYQRYFVHFVFFFNFIQVYGLYHSLRLLWRKLVAHRRVSTS